MATAPANPTSPGADLGRVAAMRRQAASGAARLRRQAAAAGLREVADAIGVSAMALSRWERGVNRPGPEAAKRWAQVLDAIEGGAP